MMEPITVILDELTRTLKGISYDEQVALAEKINSAQHVFVAGCGRSGMMAKCFTMRLMHMGIAAYSVGEVVTPSIRRGDLLVIASGSGTTASLVEMAKKALTVGADVATITIYPEAAIGRMSCAVVRIDAPTAKSDVDHGFRSVQPMASLFEQSLMICFDYVIKILMDIRGVTGEEMFARHANLE